MSTDAHASPERGELGILIGFDGSEHARDALLYAARAAQRAGTQLTVVNAYTIPPMVYGVPAEFSVEDSLENSAQGVLDEARKLLHDYPGKVTFLIERGDAAGVMVRLSAEAQVAVVGARGRGGFVGRILGSVSSALPAHSRCPTVVVPAEYAADAPSGVERFTPPRDDSPVVVGVDGSEPSRVAALAAAKVADARSAPLTLSMTVPPPESFNPWYPSGINSEATMARLQQLEDEIEQEAARLRELFPALQTTVHVELGDPVEALAEGSTSVQLTVVGTRGHGRVVRTLLGSISRGVLLRAKGAVMVAPTPHD